MFSGLATAQTVTDTVVYTPTYLMESLMSDLNQCDLDRIELKKAKAELALIYIDLAKKDAALVSLKNDLKAVREERDTLDAQNMQLTIDNGKQLKKTKHARHWLIASLAAGLGSSFAVHYDWKNSWFHDLINK